MLMPSIFGENLFDDWFDEFPFYDMDKEMNNTEKKLYGKKAGRIMKTDIKEQKDVKAEFKHGILKLFVPKKEAKKAVEENKYIAIEG